MSSLLLLGSSFSGAGSIFTVSDARIIHPGMPGPHVYIPQKWEGSVIYFLAVDVFEP
jgi:hypothetical protein